MAIAPLGREYVTRVQTLPDRRDGLRARERVTAYAAFATASLGLLLAGSGVYSLLAWLLAQRTREFGIRSALGASRGTLRTMVIGEAMLLAAIGVVIGVPTALGAGRLLSSALPDLAGWDPASLAVSGVVLAAAGLLAGVGPALRIGRTDPIVALRSE
jgi:ABC-type antimicrobial peptide transport system permease subunit